MLRNLVKRWKLNTNMPLSKKGTKIKKAMTKQYGKKKGESVFYAMERSGKLKGVKKAKNTRSK